MFYILMLFSLFWAIWNWISYTNFSRKYDWLLSSFHRSTALWILLLVFAFSWDYSWINMQYWLYYFIMWFLWSVWIIVHFEAFKFLPSWVVSSILSLYNIPFLFIWWYFWNTPLTNSSFFWIILILLSVIFFSLSKVDFSHLNSNYKKWIFYLILRNICTLWRVVPNYYFIKYGYDFYSVLFLAEFVPLIFLFIFILFIKKSKSFSYIFSYSKIDLSKNFVYSIIPAIWVFSSFYTAYYFQNLNPWIITVVLSSATIFIALIAHFFMQEPLKLKQWIFILLWFLGLIFIW